MTDDTALVPTDPTHIAPVDELVDRARDFASHADARNTLRAYRADWMHFAGWCAERRLDPVPAAPATLALYLTDHARALKPSTLRRRRVAIARAHAARELRAPFDDPTVRAVWKGIVRTVGSEQTRRAPLLADDVRLIVGRLDASLAARRDRALLLVGYSGAFRRSELVALDVADLEFVRDGVRVHVRRSKTDQEGKGTVKPIPRGTRPETCPVAALRAWLTAAEISEGPVFRAVSRHGRAAAGRLSDRAVDDVVKRAVATIGLDPGRYGAHSLRAGFATQAAANGASDRVIMKMTGHKSRATLDRYVRDGREWRENAAAMLGL